MGHYILKYFYTQSPISFRGSRNPCVGLVGTVPQDILFFLLFLSPSLSLYIRLKQFLLWFLQLYFFPCVQVTDKPIYSTFLFFLDIFLCQWEILVYFDFSMEDSHLFHHCVSCPIYIFKHCYVSYDFPLIPAFLTHLWLSIDVSSLVLQWGLQELDTLAVVHGPVRPRATGLEACSTWQIAMCVHTYVHVCTCAHVCVCYGAPSLRPLLCSLNLPLLHHARGGIWEGREPRSRIKLRCADLRQQSLWIGKWCL